MARTRLISPEVLARAAEIVHSYTTLVTLRQLFYRLVSAEVIPNTQGAYKLLSAATAQARREHAFPALMDRGRVIHRYQSWDSPAAAMSSVVSWYQRDRTEGQEVSVYLGVEKAGIVSQLQEWFGESGVPVLALGGYASQTYADVVSGDARRQGRPAVLLYAGDFDPSGEDIDRDFIERTDCWAKVVRVALTPGQVQEYDLPPLPGKETDSRARKFIERHGTLMQVELDALDPDDLRSLFTGAVRPFWDMSAYRAARHREEAERERLILARDWLAGRP